MGTTLPTPEQIALLDDVRDEWLTHGLSTEPADRPAAEEGVRMAYREVGLEPPTQMLWYDSPLAAARALAELARNQVGSRVWDQVWSQVWYRVWHQVWNQVQHQVGDQVQNQVWAQVREQVWSQVWNQVGGQVWKQVGDQVWKQVGRQVWAAIYGQHDADWCAQVAAYKKLGVDVGGDGLLKVAASAGWWWPLKDVAVLSERPNLLARDGQGRLHSETGPALRYPDGWAIHALHGVVVPAERQQLDEIAMVTD